MRIEDFTVQFAANVVTSSFSKEKCDQPKRLSACSFQRLLHNISHHLKIKKWIVQNAEKYGFNFALSMIKLDGFCGKTEYGDYNLESLL
jgi:hypothetical protein